MWGIAASHGPVVLIGSSDRKMVVRPIIFHVLSDPSQTLSTGSLPDGFVRMYPKELGRCSAELLVSRAKRVRIYANGAVSCDTSRLSQIQAAKNKQHPSAVVSPRTSE